MEAGWAGTDLAPFEVPSGSRGVRGETLRCPCCAREGLLLGRPLVRPV